MPSWQKATAASLESAAVEERPIVVYFPDENDSDFELYGDLGARDSRSLR